MGQHDDKFLVPTFKYLLLSFLILTYLHEISCSYLSVTLSRRGISYSILLLFCSELIRLCCSWSFFKSHCHHDYLSIPGTILRFWDRHWQSEMSFQSSVKVTVNVFPLSGHSISSAGRLSKSIGCFCYFHFRLTITFTCQNNTFQQRPRIDGSAKYSGGWHVLKETLRSDYPFICINMIWYTLLLVGMFFKKQRCDGEMQVWGS